MKIQTCKECGSDIAPLAKHCFTCAHPIKKAVSEEELQADCYMYFKTRTVLETGYEAIFVHHNNNQSNKIAGAKARRAGVQEGMPDVQIIIPYETIFVELKIKGKKPSKDQLQMHRRLRELGFTVYVIDNFRAFATLMLALQLSLNPSIFIPIAKSWGALHDTQIEIDNDVIGIPAAPVFCTCNTFLDHLYNLRGPAEIGDDALKYFDHGRKK